MSIACISVILCIAGDDRCQWGSILLFMEDLEVALKLAIGISHN